MVNEQYGNSSNFILTAYCDHRTSKSTFELEAFLNAVLREGRQKAEIYVTLVEENGQKVILKGVNADLEPGTLRGVHKSQSGDMMRKSASSIG